MADDVALTRSVSAALAARVAAAGIGWTLAPVADVNSAPDNPVIGVRSYGATPALVARHVAAAVAGIQSAGVAACAKHFPGHGDTTVDSHLGLATVGPDLAGALEPFRAAVAAGVATVMTGHLLVPGYGELPATLNPALVDGLLRDELGFDGVVVSDALEMGAIAGSVGVGEGAVLALLAGVDALCLGGDEAGEPIADAARDALVAAVRSGRLAEERLAAAAGPGAGAGRPRPGPGRAGRARPGRGAAGSAVGRRRAAGVRRAGGGAARPGADDRGRADRLGAGRVAARRDRARRRARTTRCPRCRPAGRWSSSPGTRPGSAGSGARSPGCSPPGPTRSWSRWACPGRSRRRAAGSPPAAPRPRAPAPPPNSCSGRRREPAAHSPGTPAPLTPPAAATGAVARRAGAGGRGRRVVGAGVRR